LRRAETDVVALVREVAAEQQAVARDHMLQLVLPDTRLCGRWDQSRLRRVIDNLLGNATKYSPAGGTIELEVCQRASEGRLWAVVSVRDHGVGIPQRELGLVFEPFFRASNVAEVRRGTGIGLSGARQIVQAHGGRIEIDSVENEGTAVTVWLPLP
jgi:signal transduction histidine kinase